MFWQRLFFWRRERDIFTFWDGKRTRRIDPMPLTFEMWTDPDCEPVRDFTLADSGDREAWLRVQAMVCRLFGIKTLEQGGLTEYEISKVMADFLEFINGLKKKREVSRTLSAPSAWALPDQSTTPPDAESCSTPNESNSDEPSTSSPECQSPSGT